ITPGANQVGSMPALLLAQVLERLVERVAIGGIADDGWLEATLVRPWAVHDHDALRRVALAATVLVPRASAALAQHYGAMCARVDRSGTPLTWPRRTRGNRLRVVLLVGDDDAAARSQAALCALPADRFDVTSVRARSADAEARRLAALDADIVIDLAGLTAPVGVTLARRPARTRMTLATLPAHNHPPLVDHVADDMGALVEQLALLQAGIEDHDDEAPDAAAMNALWASAVEAHRVGDRATALAQYQ